MKMTSWVLIITIFGASSQSGVSVAMHDFNSEASCRQAAALWYASIPRDDNGKYYSTGNGAPRAICVPK